ncbi:MULTISPECIES: acyltransferase family protein [unclassified Rathayibacter]|uniref:acyltransferase family protein n=1 Tax=unclassified Rathayibacter TaxID=2609250 RepID=UPI00188CAD22|nr:MULTISPECIES: acyltransferase [unclassified Rathayibacter]MBF4463501.1 acyltransferase [Rathayibacter sp. VKM Ac-2879]MBF4504777.1 acyltransferase [Rathayibacter sp. VKM Ac-2878]
MTPPRSRSAALDAVRVLGLIAVVACHVWSAPLWARELFFTWNVPVFFFLSGYLWTERRPFRVELGKRTSTLAVPLLAWLAILFPIWLVQQGIVGGLTLSSAWRPLAGGNYIGRPFSTFWFVSALFFVALAYRLLQRFPLIVHVVVALVLLALVAVSPEAFALLPLGIGTGLASLVFVVAGVLAQRYRSRVRRDVLVAVVLLVVSTVLVVTRVSAPLDLKRADAGTPFLSAFVAIAISFALVLLAERYVPLLGERVGRSIVFLSSGGLFVVFAHPIMLWILNSREDGTLLDFAFALLVPWIVASLVRFTPLSAALTGVPRATREPALVGR